MTTPIGVLLLQLGTPDEPTPRAVRRYLREFLGDPRVIQPPKRWQRFPRLWRAFWWCILNGIILITRPRRSAAKYQLIWDEQTGSPLRHYTRRQAEELQRCLPDGFTVRYAMRYGHPSIAGVVREMVAAGIERLIVFSLYPQYSATTTASALDGLFQALQREHRVPALRIVPPYHEHPAYLDAVTALIEEQLRRLPAEPEHYLLSYHGIPQVYTQRGDPYARHVERTSRALVERLGWKRGTWSRTYQSLFGKEEWLKPYTEEKLKELARRGVQRVFVATPGFTTDCLETIDEIGREAAHTFKEAGGIELHRCPCLNDHPQWIEAMRALVLEEAQGWCEGKPAEGVVDAREPHPVSLPRRG